MQIHVARAGKELGAFSQEEVRARLASGELLPTDHGWADGQTDWIVLSAFPGLASAPPEAAAPGISSQPEEPAPEPDEEPEENSGFSKTATPAARSARRPRPAPIAGDAILSLVFGLLSISLLPVLPAIPAIVLGRSAQARIKRSAGALRGGSLAQIGLFTGYMGAALAVIALLAAVAMSVTGYVQAKNAQSRGLRNGETIAMACRAYAAVHQGAFPETLEKLFPDYVTDREAFLCPLSGGPSEPIGFEYYGGKESDPGTNVLLVSKARGGGRSRIVVYVDATARVVRGMRELPPH